jgi:hypothetical protein
MHVVRRLTILVPYAGLLVLGCSPEPRWVALADPTARVVTLFRPDLSVLDTVVPGGVRDSTRELSGLWPGLDGSTLYVGWRGPRSSTLERIRVSDGTVLDRAAVPHGDLAAVSVLPDGRTLLVGTVQQTGDGIASAVQFLSADLATAPVGVDVCTDSLRGIATVKATDKLYVLCGGDQLIEVDKRLRSAVRSTTLGSENGLPCGATALSLAPNGTIVYVLCHRSGQLLYVDRPRLTPFDSADVGTGGTDFVRSPDGRVAVIMRPAGLGIVVFDVRRRTRVADVRTSSEPRGLAVGIDSRTVFVVTGGDDGPGQLVAIGLTDGGIRADVEAPAAALGPTVWPAEDGPVMRWTLGRR